MPNLSLKHWLGIGALAFIAVVCIVAKARHSNPVKAAQVEPPSPSTGYDTAQEIKKATQTIADTDQAIGGPKANVAPPAQPQPQPNPMQAQNVMQAQQMQQLMAQAYLRSMNAGAPRREESAAATESGKSFVMSFRDDEVRGTAAAPVIDGTAKPKDDAGGGFACGSEEDYWSACIPEGSVIMTAITNELRGDFTGPVMAQVSQPLMSKDKKNVLVPAGTIVLGESGRVGGQEQSRLAIGFHRMILSEGAAYHRAGWAISLDKLQGLSVDGSSGQEGNVNHHWGSTIAASAAYGLLAGFSLAGTGSVLTEGGLGVYRQGISQAAGQQGQQTLSRMMNRMPTITVPVGSECDVYVATDLRMRQ